MQRRRFMVFDGTPEEYAELQRRGIEEFQRRILAVWEIVAGPPGEPDWIERLAQSGDATRFFRHPRHNRYTSHAFFVGRLGMWRDIELHWNRRTAAASMVSILPPGGRAAAPQESVWVVVSFFDRDRFHACHPQSILTIDAVNIAESLRACSKSPCEHEKLGR